MAQNMYILGSIICFNILIWISGCGGPKWTDYIIYWTILIHTKDVLLFFKRN